MGRSVGIDVGTANWAVAVMEGSRPMVVPNLDGATITPSVVAYPTDGGRLIGGPARRRRSLDPERTVVDAQRYIGRRYDDVVREGSQTPYGLEAGPDGAVRFRVGARTVAAEAVAAQIIRQLIDDAARFVGTPVSDAVIAVPQSFDRAQRLAIREAGRMAGIEIIRIIDEPRAAMLARQVADGPVARGEVPVVMRSSEELIASGAALQAAMITGDLSGERRGPG